MPACPQCTKPLRELGRRCPFCQADLDLLVDYVGHLSGGLDKARELTQSGELGQAIWAYLEILEVDPDNAVARRQISQVVTAVRQFDATMPGRRWATKPPPSSIWDWDWPKLVTVATVVVLAFIFGVLIALPRTSSSDADRPNNGAIDKNAQM